MRSDTALGQTLRANITRPTGSPFVFVKKRVKKIANCGDTNDGCQQPKKDSPQRGLDIKA